MDTWDNIQSSIKKSLRLDSEFKKNWKSEITEISNGAYQIKLIHENGIEISLQETDFEKGICAALNDAKMLEEKIQKESITEFIFDGNKFGSPSSFFKYSQEILTYNLGWKTARNLDAFSDLLEGGFGRHAYGEIIRVKLINMAKSRRKLDTKFL